MAIFEFGNPRKIDLEFNWVYITGCIHARTPPPICLVPYYIYGRDSWVCTERCGGYSSTQKYVLKALYWWIIRDILFLWIHIIHKLCISGMSFWLEVWWIGQVVSFVAPLSGFCNLFEKSFMEFIRNVYARMCDFMVYIARKSAYVKNLSPC